KGDWAGARGTAWTYSAGFQLKGLSLNSQTGYDTFTELNYKFPRRKKLCGNNAFPAQAELVAGIDQ
ncbi:MAG: hypothetical protein ACRCYQ_00980, partial [Nocardioides sp.]